ncbi:hypothetical protein GC209_09675 [bacterium]|nr:hypothetical protein [bacterium]
MQLLRTVAETEFSPVGFGIRVLLLTAESGGGAIGRGLAGLGSQIDVVDEVFTALSDILDDPIGYGLFVIDCESGNVGGLEGGRRAVQMMGDIIGRVPVILISKECGTQSFPEDRMKPTQLRAPLSVISLRVGFEHALRERLAYRAA